MNTIKKLGTNKEACAKSIPISKASFPSPFQSGLEYSAPARGTWNIVHTGMLIPESHQIFVCAQGCLRGVVLTAAELGMSERFSTICVTQNNVISGDNEELIIEGVTDIIRKLPKKPRAILVYTSCVHHFLGCDLSVCYKELRERFPDIKFTDCYMNPIMRKSGMTPDAKMRLRLYSLLDKKELSQNIVSIVGNDFKTDKDSEITALLHNNGYKLLEIQDCNSFDEYLELSKASHCITTFPSSMAAGKHLKKEHGQNHMHLPFSFNCDEITENYRTLCDNLNIELPDFSKLKDKCKIALTNLYMHIGNTPINIDYTAFTRPLSLARLLLDNGFNVKTIYADSFTFEEENDFKYLQNNYPDVLLLPTVHTCMRVEPRISEEKTIAIGQKAAYFSGTEHFVNIVENGGYYGFEAILKLCRDIREAFDTRKDTKKLIQIKGMGCCSCS